MKLFNGIYTAEVSELKEAKRMRKYPTIVRIISILGMSAVVPQVSYADEIVGVKSYEGILILASVVVVALLANMYTTK